MSGPKKSSSLDSVAELEEFLKASGVEAEVKGMMKAMFEVSKSII